MTLLQIVGEPLLVNGIARGYELQDRVAELLKVVGLRPEYMNRYPHAFSGGQGAGYLALTAAQGLEFITRGDSAYRELRSYGQHNVWLCMMGRAALDGDLRTFQEKVLALDIAFDELAVRCATLRGETLSFGWQGPFLRDGEEVPITGFKHYDNPYCVAELPARQIDIRYGDQLMRLDLVVQD